ncbi:receptor-like protein kinase [Trifolium pratense]|uniref:RING-type E3 ubiquitin transferase n=1 Tax=Trifolium pratense TaxID=57577 RepID=A0A2K3MDU3_TRIPR|nr:receptor-like protein kinase [Trifolium pratense]
MTLMLVSLLANEHEQNIPSVGCPFNLSCTHDNNKHILELPAHPIPIKLRVSYINYTSQVLEAHDLENCLPRLLLQQYNFSSSIYPFQIVSSTPSQFDDFTNISFFDCSALRKHHLTDDYIYYWNYESVQQDMISCPIYVAGFDEDIVESNLVSCTNMCSRT